MYISNSLVCYFQQDVTESWEDFKDDLSDTWEDVKGE